jgi:DNA invertase Pin-like site-specific DNA recombinase
MKRVALYARDLPGGHTAADQLRDLDAIAGRLGWQVVERFVENGAPRAGAGGGGGGPPAFDRLMKAIGRREVELVAAWSLDRFARPLPDLVALINDLCGRGVDLYLHRPGLDTCTPEGRVLYEVLRVVAECERTRLAEAMVAGLAEAWTVRGVRPETREAAREAAAAQGMSVGAWLDRALWQAAEAVLNPAPGPASGEEVERIVARLLDERLQPVVTRLERLAEGKDTGGPASAH